MFARVSIPRFPREDWQLAYFAAERFIKPRLAAIGRVAMNDSVFGRFVDGRNCRA